LIILSIYEISYCHRRYRKLNRWSVQLIKFSIYEISYCKTISRELKALSIYTPPFQRSGSRWPHSSTETYSWNYNLIIYKFVHDCNIYIYIYILYMFYPKFHISVCSRQTLNPVFYSIKSTSYCLKKHYVKLYLNCFSKLQS